MAVSAPQPEDRPALAAEAVRARLRARLGEAAALLEDDGGDPVETVHSFRKHMKRARAAIRLLADADGLDLRFIEQTCRDVARQLSALRDLDVMIAALDALDPGTGAFPGALRERLVAERAQVLSEGVLEPAARRAMAEQLRAVEAEVAGLPVAHLSERDLVRALDRSRHRGRKAVTRARLDACDEHFHELRKRAKRELYQREQLEGVVALPEAARAAGLDALCDLLGEHQDLAVLKARAAQAGELPPDLERWLGDRRARIREELARRAAELYG